MKQKIEVINTIDINEDFVILVAKKIKTEPKKCKDCPCFKKIADVNEHYCTRHRALVDETDICIEEGM